MKEAINDCGQFRGRLMEAYVQSRAWDRDYYWVRLTDDGCDELDGPPRSDYRELVRMVDATSASPSLLIAQAPTGELYVLLKGLRSGRHARLNTIILNSLLVVLPDSDERQVRAAATALLTRSRKDPEDPSEADGFNQDAVARINACIGDGATPDEYRVDAGGLRAVWHELANCPITVQPPAGNTTPKAARNTLPRRAELAIEFGDSRLPLAKCPGSLRPVIVVTRNKSPEALVAAGAWRVLSRLAAQDAWYVVAPETRREASVEGLPHQESGEQKTAIDRISGVGCWFGRWFFGRCAGATRKRL